MPPHLVRRRLLRRASPVAGRLPPTVVRHVERPLTAQLWTLPVCKGRCSQRPPGHRDSRRHHGNAMQHDRLRSWTAATAGLWRVKRSQDGNTTVKQPAGIPFAARPDRDWETPTGALRASLKPTNCIIFQKQFAVHSQPETSASICSYCFPTAGGVARSDRWQMASNATLARAF